MMNFQNNIIEFCLNFTLINKKCLNISEKKLLCRSVNNIPQIHIESSESLQQVLCDFKSLGGRFKASSNTNNNTNTNNNNTNNNNNNNNNSNNNNNNNNNEKKIACLIAG